MTPTNLTYTREYGYSTGAWGDLLTSYWGVPITYDAVGNPTDYNNGDGYTFVWQGRRLISGDAQWGATFSFTYDADGLRRTRTVDGVTTTYYYDGSLLVSEQTDTYTIIYIYDANGSPVGMQYRLNTYPLDTWDVYWFEKNIQGDIVAIYNASGTKLVSYVYDAWGNVTRTYHNGGANTGAAKNPFTYRGYYYDWDIRFYYLQSRYYDPVVSRFINADDSAVIAATPDALTDKNLYAYCDNNPVMRSDDGGEFWHIVIGAVAGFAGQLVNDLITSALEGELSFSHWSSYLGAAAGGAVAALIPDSSGVLSGAVNSAVSSLVSCVAYNAESAILGRDEMYSSNEILYKTVTGAMIGAGSALLFHGSKAESMISKITSEKWESFLSEFVGGISVFDAFSNAIDFPAAYSWKSPNVGRWYVFR